MDPVLHSIRHNRLKIVSVKPLKDNDLSIVSAALESHDQEGNEIGTLGGRGQVVMANTLAFGDVVIKGYYRGGVLGRLIENWHLRLGEVSRAQHEFRVLSDVREWGISAPRPLVYIETPGRIYRTWLVTERIQDVRRLSESGSGVRKDLVIAGIERLADQVYVLIEHGLLHIDLHPGNVLINEQGEIFILDFDKAYLKSCSKRSLRDSYLHRWRRAVLKHNLPDLYSEHFSLCLRRRDALIKANCAAAGGGPRSEKSCDGAG